MTNTARTFSKRVTRRVALDYLLHRPPGRSRKHTWPLIVFLHGSDESGSDLSRLKRNGIPSIVERDPSFPFVAVSPQCPERSTWVMQADALLMLLDEVIRVCAADPARVCLTGMSLGGYGAWYLGSEHPERFAAVVPICGGYDEALGYPERVCGLRYTPVWAFHGAKDREVPVSETRRLVRVLRQCGGKPKLTIYPNTGHDAWTRTYSNPALYRWLLEQRL
jgi:predicted peptidase